MRAVCGRVCLEEGELLKNTSERSGLVRGAGRVGRREFLRCGGMALAGVAGFGGRRALAEWKILPVARLPPADAPAGVPGMTYVRASEIGCALDCDLNTGRRIRGGGEATDDGPRINAALAGATAEHPITLIVDGGALISGLYLPEGGHWSIAGLGGGTGFYIKTGTNNDGIHNGPRELILLDPGPPVPARGRDVSLSNFTLNANRGDGRNGDSTTGTPLGGSSWYFGINLMNLENVTIRNVAVVNSPAYHVRLSNVGHVMVSGCAMHSQGPHTDGVHFNGPSNDITVEDCDFYLQDDAIALNAPEGYSGDIERVTVRNCRFRTFRALRLYTLAGTGDPTFRVKDVLMTGCKGETDSEAIILGDGVSAMPASVDGVTIADCEFTAPALLELAVNFGDVTVRDVRWTPMGPVDTGYALARTDKGDQGSSYTGGALTFENCTMVRKAPDVVSGLIVTSKAYVAAVTFKGLRVEDPAGSAFPGTPELVVLANGTIGQLGLEGVDAAHIDSPVSADGFASIGSVTGKGVLATGWRFPDDVMANGSPYVSATTGRPSLKVGNGVGGEVKAYP